jgi:hypothetical protein
MKWTRLIAVALFTLSAPAFADAKGDALVKNWLAKITEIQPITAETITTYTYGKWVAVRKANYTLSGNNENQSHSDMSYDNEMPTDLVNDPLEDNMNPLPRGTDSLKVFSVADATKYLGKETVDGTSYDVVQVNEFLNLHISPPTRLFDTSKRKSYGTLAVKWYLDSDGILRRITFTAMPPAPTPSAAAAGKMEPRTMPQQHRMIGTSANR